MRTVLITGAAGGIGAATAKLFAREGWQVFGADQVEIDDTSCYAGFFKVDLADEKQIVKLLADIFSHVDGLDAVVNNAALQICKPLIETSCTEWDAVFAVNLRAAFLIMKQAFPLLRVKEGAVVNVGSVHAKVTSKNIAAYAASKGGLEALTRAAALEFAGDGIRVNVVHPGAVETNMLKAGLSRGHLAGNSVNELLAGLAAKTVVGRVGTPAEIAQAILFLADNDKSSFITGECITIDGGATAKLSTE